MAAEKSRDSKSLNNLFNHFGALWKFLKTFFWGRRGGGRGEGGQIPGSILHKLSKKSDIYQIYSFQTSGISVYQEPMSRSMQLHYILVTAFS